MPDTFNMPENVLQAGALALANLDIAEKEGRTEGRPFGFGAKADVVIQACLKEWGAAEERRDPDLPRSLGEAGIDQCRLVFPWEPVDPVLDHDTEENT